MPRRLLIPPFLSDMIISSISLFDGVTFSQITPHCRICGALLRRHDLKKKRFATLVRDDERQSVYVGVVRYRCLDCGRLWYADEPFYPGTRHGIPVVDLAAAIAVRHPYHHTARILFGLGLVLDRGTVRNYAHIRSIDSTDMYGIPVPNRIIALSGLAAEGRSIEGAELLAALGLPPADRTYLHRTASEEEGDEDEQKKEWVSQNKRESSDQN
ncbi:hypothetical protein [Methanocalculus sp.]|uniref:hypothetical protein n=1 Tax=Methanocalculus sp. TaxID=2004547 RepID=UPI00271E2C25|nr:hypothetical protein [Methanocalculus sp.]MDO8841811.1 hypothetical protein [Methanocalculus sp.]